MLCFILKEKLLNLTILQLWKKCNWGALYDREDISSVNKNHIHWQNDQMDLFDIAIVLAVSDRRNIDFHFS